MSDITLNFYAVREALGVTFDDSKCKGDVYPCALCGKPCPKNTFDARFVGGGLDEVSSNDEAADKDPGDMGCYPIGPACATKIKKHLGAEVFAKFFHKVAPR